jgi:hypothetical protein
MTTPTSSMMTPTSKEPTSKEPTPKEPTSRDICMCMYSLSGLAYSGQVTSSSSPCGHCLTVHSEVSTPKTNVPHITFHVQPPHQAHNTPPITTPITTPIKTGSVTASRMADGMFASSLFHLACHLLADVLCGEVGCPCLNYHRNQGEQASTLGL